jgi:hypothetical protein
MVCSTQNLTEMLTSRPTVLGPDDVRACAVAIRADAVRVKSAPRAPRPVPRRRHGHRRSKADPSSRSWGAVVLRAVISSGGLTKASERVGEQFVSNVVDTPSERTPTKPAKPNKQRKERQDKPR